MRVLRAVLPALREPAEAGRRQAFARGGEEGRSSAYRCSEEAEGTFRLCIHGSKRAHRLLISQTLAGGGAVTQIVRLPPCACCGRFENAHTLLRCSVCSLSVHTGEVFAASL